MALIDSAQADMPIIVAGMGAYFITEQGIKPFEAFTSGEFSLDVPQDNIALDNAQEEQAEDSNALKAQQEVKRFLRWLKKSPERHFNFQELPVVYAEVLNKFVNEKDFDSARWYAERYLA